MYHKPALLNECLEGLAIKPGGTYVDVTFGGGGHSRAILERLDTGRLLSFDQDSDAVQNALKDERFTLVQANFRHLKKFLKAYNALPIDGLLADLGVSFHQFDEAERGFSIRFEADLDMRMNVKGPISAADILNTYEEAELQRIFGEYGEVRNARTLAAAIVQQRRIKPLKKISELKAICTGLTNKAKENQYLAQVFQALRIEVNDELSALKEMLQQTAEVLKPGGILAVMSYHSLEDRLVKNFMNKGIFEGELPKDLYGNTPPVPFKQLTKKPIEPTDAEIKDNPRSRSARLRLAVKN